MLGSSSTNSCWRGKPVGRVIKGRPGPAHAELSQETLDLKARKTEGFRKQATQTGMQNSKGGHT